MDLDRTAGWMGEPDGIKVLVIDGDDTVVTFVVDQRGNEMTSFAIVRARVGRVDLGLSGRLVLGFDKVDSG